MKLYNKIILKLSPESILKFILSRVKIPRGSRISLIMYGDHVGVPQMFGDNFFVAMANARKKAV